MDKNKSLYKTQSLVLATTLICQNISLNSVVKNADGKATFVFSQTDNLTQIINNFWKKNLLVEPNSFFEAQRFLKNQIYEGGQQK